MIYSEDTTGGEVNYKARRRTAYWVSVLIKADVTTERAYLFLAMAIGQNKSCS